MFGSVMEEGTITLRFPQCCLQVLLSLDMFPSLYSVTVFFLAIIETNIKINPFDLTPY